MKMKKILFVFVFGVISLTCVSQNTRFDSLTLNSTLITPNITQKNIDTSSFKVIAIDASGHFIKMYWPTTSGGSAPFADNTALVKNTADITKLLILSAASITTATTRTWTFPDVNGTVARNDAAQTFTGTQTFSSAPTLSSLTTNGGMLYNNGSGVIQQNANIVFDATNNGVKLITPSIGITPANAKGVYLQNSTAATAGNQQYSPGMVFEGQGWKTNTTAASQAVNFREYLGVIQGAANPSFVFEWDGSINGGAYANLMNLSSAGQLVVASTIAAGGGISATGTVTATTAIGAGATSFFTWGAGTTQPNLYSDANYNMTLRNGTNAHELWVDNTWTSSTNYEAGVFGFTQNANILSIGTKIGSSGTLRNIQFIGGNIGMGIAPSTSAKLILPAGTTTVAPLLLTSGTNLTTPVNGAVEYDGTHFYGTTGGTRFQLDQQSGGAGAPFADNAALVKNNSDITKLLILSAASISTGTTRTATFPDANITVADKLTGLQQFASTTSSQLAGIISDETGSGGLVFASAPTLINPIVGTQSAADNSTKAASTAYVTTAVATREFMIYGSSSVNNSVSGTSLETTLISTSGSTGSTTLAANYLTTSKILRYRLTGYYYTKALTPGDLTIRLKVGSVTLATAVLTNLSGGVSNAAFVAIGFITIATAGTTATTLTDGTLSYSGGTLLAPRNVADLNNFTAPGSINTTISNVFDITAQWATADSQNIIGGVTCTLEALN